MNVDLHVHSKFSKRPSQWVLRKIGCPESFTEPLQIYRIARQRGMDLVTISDHNSIAGALEIAHLPGAFVSEEITTYFPDNGCKLHVLALDVTEAQHGEIGKLRKNVFDLVPYLRSEEIVHILAHPLYAVNDRLTMDHFEQLLLLFKHFELNGARNAEQNEHLRRVLSRLQPADIDRLADKHGVVPDFPEPWIKTLTGGSDDHSGLNIARTYTRVAGDTVADLLAGLRNGHAEVVSHPSTPLTMAHNFYGIAWQYYRNRLSLEPHIQKDRLLRFLDRSLSAEAEHERGLMSRIYFFLNHRNRKQSANAVPDTLMGLVRHETERLLRDNPRLMDIADEEDAFEDRERQWFDFVQRISSKVLAHSADHLLGHVSGGNVFNIFQTIGSAGGLYSLLAPYFVAFAQFTKDRSLTAEVRDRFPSRREEDPASPEKEDVMNVAHFTDTFYEVNGVAQTLQQQVEIAARNGKRLTVITCDATRREKRPGIRNFEPFGVAEIPEYRDQKICYPPFLEMLNYVYEQGFTHIQSATPGPVGLAALAISRILKLPINGTYHTAFPQYAQYLTGDHMIEDLTWKYMIWYYDQMDQIYVSSRASAEELTEKGIRMEKIRTMPRGIDVGAFHPSRKNGFYEKRFPIPEPVKLLYVGRVSKEKNLHLLVDAFRDLIKTDRNVHLVVVGDGPYLAEMKQALKDAPCTFTGYLEGDTLATAYASADLFVFPSTTDTFGNVVLEAQASGLPVIVTDQGGPHENLLPGETGLVVPGDDQPALRDAIRTLCRDGERRRAMGRAARAYMEDRSFENAFIRAWELLRETPEPEDRGLFARAG
jgi:glycosyltransferase involved in cell wall biosynthesis